MIDEALDNALVNVVIIGHFFDMYEFEANPIKPILRTYFYNLQHEMSSGQNFYISRKKVTVMDHWLAKFMSSNEYDYFDVEYGEFFSGKANDVLS